MIGIISVLLLCLISSFLIKEIFRKFNVPMVVGQILAGIILGIPIIKTILFTHQITSIIEFLSHLGILFLLFLAGWEIDIRKIIRSAKDSVLISLFSAFVPFILGFSFIYFGFNSFITSQGFNPLIVATVFGIALSVTAEATSVKVLMDLKVLNTKIGAIMIGAGAIDDIIEVLGLSLVVLLASGSIQNLLLFPIQLFLFVILCFIFFKLISKILRYIEIKETDEDLYLLTLLLVFGIATLSEYLQLGYLIGAIVAGFLLQLSMIKFRKTKKVKTEEQIREAIRLMTLAFLAPFFFINIGLNFEFDTLFINPLLLIGSTIIAFIGKILGTLIIKPFSKLSLKQLYIIGWAMNSRGAVELIIALTSLQFGLIPLEIFSVLIFLSLITTITFPFVLQREIMKNPKIVK